MSEPQPLTLERLADALRRLGVPFQLKSGDGAAVRVRPTPGDDTRLHLVLNVEGSFRNTLVIRGVSSQAFSMDDWPLVLAAINAWQQGHRWPRGYLHQVDDESRPFGILVAEHQQPFAAGVHDELLDETIRLLLGACVDFLLRLSSAVTAPPPATLDANTLNAWLDD